MEQRAYTRIGRGAKANGAIRKKKVAEVAEVVATQIRLAREVGAEACRVVATAAIREAKNSSDVAKAIEAEAGVPVDVISEEEEGRLAFLGATKTLGHPVEGKVAVVDVGGGSSEIVIGTIAKGVRKVKSIPIGSGSLAESYIKSDPPAAAEIRKIRDRIDEEFKGIDMGSVEQAVAVGGSATSMRRLVGAVLEYETLERGIRVLTAAPADDVARQFELDARRVRMLPTGILILEKISEILGQPLQIGNGGLREGIILDLLTDKAAAKEAKQALAA
jgi:exopolyphosphatase/guanosine-5'-triphosphate,3'-diphosphate pyrophosphatase